MAQDGSLSVMAVNAFTVSGKKKECCIATARLNCCCAAGLHEIGRLTSPSRSSFARPTPWAPSADATRTRAIRKVPMTGSCFDFHRVAGHEFIDVSNSFIASLAMIN